MAFGRVASLFGRAFGSGKAQDNLQTALVPLRLDQSLDLGQRRLDLVLAGAGVHRSPGVAGQLPFLAHRRQGSHRQQLPLPRGQPRSSQHSAIRVAQDEAAKVRVKAVEPRFHRRLVLAVDHAKQGSPPLHLIPFAGRLLGIQGPEASRPIEDLVGLHLPRHPREEVDHKDHLPEGAGRRAVQGSALPLDLVPAAEHTGGEQTAQLSFSDVQHRPWEPQDTERGNHPDVDRPAARRDAQAPGSTPVKVAELAAALSAHFGPQVVVLASELDGTVADLFPEERASVAHAKEKRLAEFCTGRRLAHQALLQLGLPPTALPMREDRRPAWPPEVLASISHTKGVAVVVAAPKREVELLGVDVEVDQDLAEHIHRVVLTPTEQATLAAGEPERRGRMALVHFSAKECLYKAQYPVTETFLEFQDVDLTLDGPHFSGVVHQEVAAQKLPPRLDGFWVQAGGWLATGLKKP